MFPALVLEKSPEFSAAVREVDDSFLPEADVTVAVEYSTVNYKDALAITNRSPVVRSWPMVAGIDGAGTVLESATPKWKAGDAVVLNGFGVGETHKGCLAGKARLKGEWLIRRPPAFSARQAMATAARLISSARTSWATTGPGRYSTRLVCWLKTLTPVTSLGRRSGVNWMRSN